MIKFRKFFLYIPSVTLYDYTKIIEVSVLKHKKLLKAVICTIVVIMMLVLINLIPTFNLSTGNMNVLTGHWVNVYYENEREAAIDTYGLADARAAELAILLGVTKKPDINIYIYDDQSTMQTKKYGLIAPLLGLDWYIGDNIGTNVILTSPANPGKVHDYNNNKQAVLHEMVHAFNSVINPSMTYWVDNGLAGYLSEQVPNSEHLQSQPVPTLVQTRVGGLFSPMTFADFDGYEFSYTYIDYLVETYSWDCVREFAKNGDFEKSFGRSEKEIYDEWVHYLAVQYRDQA